MADTKASAFTTTTTMAGTDVFPVITGIGGTPANKIISKSDLKTDLALVKADVGLGSVDNTADTAKPVSTAQQTALDLKAPLASPTFTGTVAGITASMVGAPSGSGTSTGTNTGDQTVPTNAAGTDLDTGTDTTKFATAKAIKDAHNVPSVVPGTAGNVLTSDGTDWTSAAAGGGGGGGLPSGSQAGVFRVHTSADLNISSGGTNMNFDTVDTDPGSNFNTGTFSYVAPATGTYLFTASMLLTATSTSGNNNFVFMVNGSFSYPTTYGSAHDVPTSGMIQATTIIPLTSGDAVKIQIFVSGTVASEPRRTWFAGHHIA